MKVIRINWKKLREATENASTCEYKITQNTIAEHIGISNVQLSRIINGYATSDITLAKIVAFLNRPINTNWYTRRLIKPFSVNDFIIK